MEQQAQLIVVIRVITNVAGGYVKKEGMLIDAMLPMLVSMILGTTTGLIVVPLRLVLGELVMLLTFVTPPGPMAPAPETIVMMIQELPTIAREAVMAQTVVTMRPTVILALLLPQLCTLTKPMLLPKIPILSMLVFPLLSFPLYTMTQTSETWLIIIS